MTELTNDAEPSKKWPRRSPTRMTWGSMIARCTNPNHPAQRYYHAREIEVCERWRKYENFLVDMGERPKGTTLDRIDNDKGYFKENCRWATYQEQNRNKRNTWLITYQGETKPAIEWGELFGISYACLKYRTAAGWSIERMLSEPSNALHRKKSVRKAAEKKHDQSR